MTSSPYLATKERAHQECIPASYQSLTGRRKPGYDEGDGEYLFHNETIKKFGIHNKT